MKSRKRPHDAPSLGGKLLTPEEGFTPKIPQTEEEWALESQKVKIDANDLAHNDELLSWLNSSDTIVAKWPEDNGPCVVPLRTILSHYPNLRFPIIQGLLRRSEVMNIVAPPKAGKSWLALNIAMNIIGGGKFLGQFQCERGPVLVCDNELHCETIADRAKTVAEAFNVPIDRAARLIDYLPLRGMLTDVDKLEAIFERIRPRHYNAIILDAFYKFYPVTFDENSNAEMANMYNKLDYYAEYLDAPLILIHHTSKGSQSAKAVTDVGAGAGAQTRACDAHLILREHEDNGVFVIDAANRSFKPISPFCARFKFPKWELVEHADPEALKGLKKKPGDQRVGSNTPAPTSTSERKSNISPEDIKTIDELLKSLTTPTPISEIIRLGTGRIRQWKKSHVYAQIAAWKRDGVLREVAAGGGRSAATFVYVERNISDSTEALDSTDGTDDNEDVNEDNPFDS